MNRQLIAKYGVLLGVLLGIWTFVMGFTGWDKDPVLAALFLVVVLIQIAVLTMALRTSAKMGQTYGKQVLTGLLICLVAGVIVIGNSLLFTTVAFPNYFDELRQVLTRTLTRRGISAEQVRNMQQTTAFVMTPGIWAISEFLRTVITGLILSLVISAFARAKGIGKGNSKGF